MEQIKRAFRYWLTAIIKPRQVFEEFKADPDQLVVSLWIMVLFSIFYTVTVGIFALTGRIPAIKPWMPIAEESYYFYQVFWTIPWGLATGILLAGVAHVMAVLGRQNSKVSFEGALAVISIAWIIPSFVLMWLPETFIAPFSEQLLWPSWLEVVRLSVLAPIWQVVLTIVGMRVSHHTGWIRAILIGLVTTAISFMMFLPFMR